MVAIVLGAVSLLAQASAWHVINVNPTDPTDRLEVDNATLKKVGNVVTVWSRQTFANPQPLDNTGAVFDMALNHQSIDCMNDTFVTTTATFFKGKAMVTTTSFPKTDIPPDSIIQTIEKAVCP